MVLLLVSEDCSVRPQNFHLCYESCTAFVTRLPSAVMHACLNIMQATSQAKSGLKLASFMFKPPLHHMLAYSRVPTCSSLFIQVLQGFNATDKDLDEQHAGKTMSQIFEGWAERQPQARCLIFEGKELTYGEVNSRANQLAHHIIQLGVKPDSCVGIMMERSLGEAFCCSMRVGKSGLENHVF